MFCRDLWIHIYREQTLDNDKLALVSASLIREKFNRVLFRMLPTEVHMLRETTGSEKQVLRTPLLTITFRVVFINTLKYVTLFQGPLEKRAAIIIIVFTRVEKLNKKISENRRARGTDVVQCCSQ